jgi:hypothetical protein
VSPAASWKPSSETDTSTQGTRSEVISEASSTGAARFELKALRRSRQSTRFRATP